MRPFSCSVCGQLLFFHNSACLRCGSDLGYDPDRLVLDALEPADPIAVDGAELPPPSADDQAAQVAAPAVAADHPGGPASFVAESLPGAFRTCANRTIAQCNWLVAESDDDPLCASCRLTTIRPNDGEDEALAEFADAEGAKRRLLYQLAELGLPITGKDSGNDGGDVEGPVDEDRGVAFEFLSSQNRKVITGHQGGVITLDLAESDDAHREFVRQQLGEPYRTVLGHLRHEIGHYYWPILVEDRGHIDEFRALFGDERISYEDAKDQHYGGDGAVANGAAPVADGAAWVDTHVSEYATMHPWEDWAETFAHYLHIHGGLDTADAFGLRLDDPVRSAAREAYGADRDVAVGTTVEKWLALTLALNGMSRSIGQGDLYPFVLSRQVIEKLDFVHRMVTALADESSAPERGSDRRGRSRTVGLLRRGRRSP